MNKPIQLTEQDLHMLVEDAVKTYLTENGMDEGWEHPRPVEWIEQFKAAT